MSDKILNLVTSSQETAQLLTDKLRNLYELDKNIDKGVSLLTIRMHSLLSYSLSLILVSITKLNGKTLNPDLVKHLVGLRLVLEKTKPIEQKLKYQIDKLLQSTVQDSAELLPLSFKPQPRMLKTEEREESDVYKPPKIAPVGFDTKDRKRELTERQLEKASRSRLLRDLAAQYDERPEEMDAEGTGYGSKGAAAARDDEIIKEREQYEEENFMRLSKTKQDKKREKRMQKQGALIRFRNEFEELHRDFKEISHVHGVVENKADTKAHKSKKNVYESGNKRKFDGAGDMISKMAKQRRAEKGKDKFTATKRIVEKFKK